MTEKWRMLLFSIHKKQWQPTENGLTSEYILVPITLDKWGFSSKQFLWQYNLQRSAHTHSFLLAARVKPVDQSDRGGERCTSDSVLQASDRNTAVQRWFHMWWLSLREIITISVRTHSRPARNVQFKTKSSTSIITAWHYFHTNLLLWKLWRN